MNEPEPDPEPAPRTTRVVTQSAWSRARLEGQFRIAVFFLLLLVGAVATLRAYLALENAITIWLRPQFIPLVQAAFSLAIVGVCVWLIRSWVIARGD
jgi:hypothetical protein